MDGEDRFLKFAERMSEAEKGVATRVCKQFQVQDEDFKEMSTSLDSKTPVGDPSQ